MFNEGVVIKSFEVCGEKNVIWFSTQQVTQVHLAELGGGIVGYPQINCVELSKKLKNGLKIIHCTLSSCLNFINVNFLQLMK